MKKIKSKVANKTLLMVSPYADRIYIYLLLNSSFFDSEYRRTKHISIEDISIALGIDKLEVEDSMNFLKLCARVKEDGKYLKVLQEDYEIIVPPDLISRFCSSEPLYMDVYLAVLEYWARRKVFNSADLYYALYPFRDSSIIDVKELRAIQTAMKTLRAEGYIEFYVVNTQLIDGNFIDTYEIKWVSPKPISTGYKTQIFDKKTVDKLINAIHKAREYYC